MALETGTYISDLNPANPSGGDFVEQGDDHLRLLKSTLKNTFPNVDGAVSATPSQLNNVVTAYDHRVPTGGIIMWSGASTAIPTGWLLCDGTGGTPNLRDRFVVGAGSTYAVGATGGSKDATLVAHSHNVTGTAASNGAHTHSISDPGHNHTWPYTGMNGTSLGAGSMAESGSQNYATTMSGTNISINSGGAHTHSVTGTTDSQGNSATNANLPPYFALCFIMKS